MSIAGTRDIRWVIARLTLGVYQLKQGELLFKPSTDSKSEAFCKGCRNVC